MICAGYPQGGIDTCQGDSGGPLFGRTAAGDLKVVGALYGTIAGILALRGKKKVQQATPPLPEETVQSVKEDVRYTKQRAQEARR